MIILCNLCPTGPDNKLACATFSILRVFYSSAGSSRLTLLLIEWSIFMNAFFAAHFNFRDVKFADVSSFRTCSDWKECSQIPLVSHQLISHLFYQSYFVSVLCLGLVICAPFACAAECMNGEVVLASFREQAPPHVQLDISPLAEEIFHKKHRFTFFLPENYHRVKGQLTDNKTFTVPLQFWSCLWLAQKQYACVIACTYVEPWPLLSTVPVHIVMVAAMTFWTLLTTTMEI